MSWQQFDHFSHLPLTQRVLFTGALCVLGLGYAFAMIHVFASHHNRDGEEMLTVDDIVIAYSGTNAGTQLEAALMGPMSNMLPPEENMKIIEWVRKGVSEETYHTEVKAIFDQRCIICHNQRNPHLPHLETYEGVSHTTESDHGFDIFTLVKVSHIHLFGLTFIFFIVGFIFSHAYLRQEWIKNTLIAIPFIAIILDIASWYITKIYNPFAWVVIISGAAMGTSFGLQFLISIYQMWFYTLPEDVEQQEPGNKTQTVDGERNLLSI